MFRNNALVFISSTIPRLHHIVVCWCHWEDWFAVKYLGAELLETVYVDLDAQDLCS